MTCEASLSCGRGGKGKGMEGSKGKKDRGKFVTAPQICLRWLFLKSPSGAYVFSFCRVDRGREIGRGRETCFSVSLPKIQEAEDLGHKPDLGDLGRH